MRFPLAGVVLLLATLLAPGAQAKTFRINVVADPAQMDPITLSEIVAGRILRNVYEGFTVTADDGRNVPALAERWEPLTPGPGFRFFLRRGVTFHSGRSFTAKDVKYTLEELLRPGSKGGLGNSQRQFLDGGMVHQKSSRYVRTNRLRTPEDKNKTWVAPPTIRSSA